jgi:hypothetical protein
VKNVDDLNCFAGYAVDDAIGWFDEFSNAGPFVAVNESAEVGKC